MGKLGNVAKGLLGFLLLVLGVGWYIWPKEMMSGLNNLEALVTVIQGTLGLVIIIIGAVLIIISRD